MPTLLSWTSVGIGDLDVFIPSPPCLVVYTSYADDQPESTVTFFWQEEEHRDRPSSAAVYGAGPVRDGPQMGAGDMRLREILNGFMSNMREQENRPS